MCFRPSDFGMGGIFYPLDFYTLSDCVAITEGVSFNLDI